MLVGCTDAGYEVECVADGLTGVLVEGLALGSTVPVWLVV